MSDYDILIKNGTVVDGLRNPAFHGDVGISGGRITAIAMGRLEGSARRVIDATGMVVAPGFIDLHTHYDAALSGWDPYASISGWHGVTTVAIGNCGFGFAPVRPEDRERAMLRMERTESIPLEVMQASMRWDWVTFPEFLQSLARHRIGVNAAPLVPLSPMRAYVMGDAASRDPDYVPTPEQIEEMKNLLRMGMEAGAFGWSFSFSMANRDHDGGYLPTHVIRREEFLELARVLREFRRGSIEGTVGVSVHGLGLDFFTELAVESGRPVNWNAIAHDPNNPDMWRQQLKWTEETFRRAVVLPVNLCTPVNFEFDLETIGVFDMLPAWNEATVGTREERKAKLADPTRRPKLKQDLEFEIRAGADGEMGQISIFKWDAMLIEHVVLDKNKRLEGMLMSEYATEVGKHPVDAFLDLAIEEDLQTEFSLRNFLNTDEDALGEIIKHPLTLVGSSDGGAHTKFLTTATYPTHFLAHWVRDRGLMSLEEAHWRLSTRTAWAVGIRDRGFISEGMPADIVVYDHGRLAVLPLEKVHDLPNNDWRWVAKANGYQATIVNGVVTFDGQRCTGELPGRVLHSAHTATG